MLTQQYPELYGVLKDQHMFCVTVCRHVKILFFHLDIKNLYTF